MSEPSIVTVWVPGIPKTKGSLDIVNRATGAMAENVDNTGWRRQIAARVRQQMVGQTVVPGLSEMSGEDLPYVPIEGPVAVNVLYVLPPPRKYLPMRSATWPQSGDVDKLQRLTGDALNAGKDAHPKDAWLLADDNLIVSWQAHKVSSAAIAYPPGALINVRRSDPGLLNAMAISTLMKAGVEPTSVGHLGF